MSWGGAREGAERPKVDKKVQRPQHAVRAWEDEWIQIKRVHRWIKTLGVQKVKQILDDIESKL